MRKPLLAGLAAVALTGGTLLSAAPAQAADPTVFYVRQLSTACSDTGPGTLAQPFCTIKPAAAAVTAGQTVDVGSGTYRERVTIASSGTPDEPIVFRSSSSTMTAVLAGPTAGITVAGEHDVTIQRFQVVGAMEAPALDLRDASGITVEGGGFGVADGASVPAVRLVGVNRSSLTRGNVSGRPLLAGVTLDAATTGVKISAMTVTASLPDDADHGVGIRVEGDDNTIVGNDIDHFTGAAITVEAGADGTVVANNQIAGGRGYGIHNHGATGTAITNNTVEDRCLDSIRVDGASTGVSVQNNLVTYGSPLGTEYCTDTVRHGVLLGVHDEAVRDTVVDYNTLDHYRSGYPTLYAWNGAQLSLADFQAASGQAAHDLETGDPRANYDSANSAAPGYPTTDRVGRARVDDPAVADTGAGPVTYADRGALETIRGPQARISLALDLGAGAVTADASSSGSGVAPIASYQFDWGDGTSTTQATPIATHRYATRGTFNVYLVVTGTDGRHDAASQQASVLPRTGTVGLLTLSGLRYVGSLAAPWPGLSGDRPALDATGQFDVVDAGSGQIALFWRAKGQYLAADFAGVQAVTAGGTLVTTNQRFTQVRNTDGTISLRAIASGRYVTAPANATTALIANATTVGTDQKFYRVTVTDTDRSLKAGANSRYVTADSAGAKPLIASRTSVGPWERFDLVDLGNGQIGIFARADNRFVSADSSGTLPLIANRTSVGAWERFTLVRNSGGTVSLKAAVNGRYVTAESAGAKPLIANRTTIGAWEKFTLG
ncbi:right-handed parallel beta-helix repeat-containing protein [Micromonospora sp. R77]|uniref:right-handed parallel beta-helix repeat-containing protein n=1 Tax=Micromonospora sp. R77 TaxID=2925836 RepID=UPI001F623369|nr:right-handed parallel beta-helix repeat-containing protein [Micromonospora sp. R77]MCI4063601.1 right-handed parallel beta-helix repeat-containing protein [Micromonospora sp. R77]